MSDLPISIFSPGVTLSPATSTRNVVQPSAADAIPLVVKGASSQSAFLQDWRNSSDTSLASIDNVGGITSASKVDAGNGAIRMAASGALLLRATGAPYIEFLEAASAPAAGAANTGRLFIVDDGGKSKLYIQFATGAAQLIATEP